MYLFNPHRHVKIWLSKDPTVFLNIENQMRLAKMRADCPGDEIHFIYSATLLNSKSLENLQQFCKKYDLIPLSIESDLLPLCVDDQEKKLAACIKQEIAHMTICGDPATVSDILRWLSPVYQLGTYSDFDVQIRTRTLPSECAVSRPFLLELGSIAISNSVHSIYLNNDIISIIDPVAARTTIQATQKKLLSAFEKPALYNFHYHVDEVNTSGKKHLSSFRYILLAEYLKKNRFEAADLEGYKATLSESQQSHFTLFMRQSLINEKALGLITYCKKTLRLNEQEEAASSDDDAEIIKSTANLYRIVLKEDTTLWRWLTSSGEDFQASIEKSEMDDEELCQLVYENYFHQLLRELTLLTTGPKAILSAIFEQSIMSKETIDSKICPFAFSHYKLDSAFHSNQSFPFNTSNSTVQKKLACKVGILNDASWLEMGAKFQLERQEKMIVANTKIQRFFKQKKISKRLSISSDLKSIFNKINHRIQQLEMSRTSFLKNIISPFNEQELLLLKKILLNFSDHSFNARAFRESIPTYREADLMGYYLHYGEIKSILDSLEVLSRQASCLSLLEGGYYIFATKPIDNIPAQAPVSI